MNSEAQANQHPRYPLPSFTDGAQDPLDFDLWAGAVRQQMIATIKRRESGRSNWGRVQRNV